MMSLRSLGQSNRASVFTGLIAGALVGGLMWAGVSLDEAKDPPDGAWLAAVLIIAIILPILGWFSYSVKRAAIGTFIGQLAVGVIPVLVQRHHIFFPVAVLNAFLWSSFSAVVFLLGGRVRSIRSGRLSVL